MNVELLGGPEVSQRRSYCNLCFEHRKLHSAGMGYCPQGGGYFVQQTPRRHLPHIFKRDGKWIVRVSHGTRQFAAQLARQHAARLNGEF